MSATGGRAIRQVGLVANAPIDAGDLRTLAARKSCLGDLINYAGMQRMLSHRAVMFLSILPHAGGQRRYDVLGQAEQAIERFGVIAGGFAGDYAAIGAPPELAGWIAGVLTGRGGGYEALTTTFRIRASKALEAARDPETPPQSAMLAELVDLVSAALLDELNGLVRDLNEQLLLTSRQEQAYVERVGNDIGAMLDDIQRVGLKIKMISVNALIQASRAGEAGRGFAVIANEIKDLSDQMQIMAAGIGSNLRKVVSH